MQAGSAVRLDVLLAVLVIRTVAGGASFREIAHEVPLPPLPSPSPLPLTGCRDNTVNVGEGNGAILIPGSMRVADAIRAEVGRGG
jgi:hypothetical protein